MKDGMLQHGMSNMKITRNRKGVVKCGKVTCTVAKDQTMLSLDSFNDGDDYTKDPHWVLDAKGNKRRPQFTNGSCLGGERVTVWTRKMEADYLPILEQKYHALKSVKEDVLKEWHRLVNKLKTVKGRTACVKFENAAVWKVYKYVEDSEGGGVRTTGSLYGANPVIARNMALGKQLHAADCRSTALISRVAKFERVLMRHLQLQMQKHDSKFHQNYWIPRVYSFTINKRVYTVLVSPGKYQSSYKFVDVQHIQIT